MVRATAAEVVKKWGGSYPAGWDATSVGNICTQMDAEIDGRASPSTFATGTNHVEFANEAVFRRINFARWAAGNMTQPPPPRPWDDDMLSWFNALLTDTTHDSISYLKLAEES